MNEPQTVLYKRIIEIKRYIESLEKQIIIWEERIMDSETQILRQKRMLKEIEDVYDQI